MTGAEWVEQLNKEHGLLEAYRIAKEYVEMQRDTKDPEEIEFCNGVRFGLWKLDMI